MAYIHACPRNASIKVEWVLRISSGCGKNFPGENYLVKQPVLITIGIAVLITLSGCGTTGSNSAATNSSTSSTSGPVTVAVSPAQQMATGGSQQFTATVTGTSNTAVTWTASGGTITSAGLFTAPASAGSYTITATSVADSSAKSSVTVSVVAAVAHSVQLNWGASATAGVNYNVYRASSVGGGQYVLLNSQPLGALTYTDGTVKSGNTYTYAVTAVDAAGLQSAFSAPANATIPVP